MVELSDLGDFPILLWDLGWLESFSLLIPLCFPPLSCPQGPLSTVGEQDRHSTPYRDTTHTASKAFAPTGSSQALQSLLVWQLRAMALQPGCHYKYSCTTSYLQYLEGSQFKSNWVTLKRIQHTLGNLLSKKSRSYNRSLRTKSATGFWRSASHCHMLIYAGILIHPAVSNQVHLDAPHTAPFPSLLHFLVKDQSQQN